MGDTEQMGDLGKLGVIRSIFDEYSLGEEIVSFYEKELVEADVEFLFVVPRKCLTEYKALVGEGDIASVYSDSEVRGAKRCKTRYGTPKSFILYVEEIKKMLDEDKDFVISVIDDIIMYGRGICHFLDKFLNYFSEADKNKVRKRIHVGAFIRNAEIPFLQEQYPDIVSTMKTYRKYREPSDLKRVSDLFLNSFAMTMTPNTSFVNSWFIKANRGEGELYRWLQQKISDEGQHIYQDYVSHLNEYRISVFEREKAGYFKDIVEFACARCYTSELSQITLIPYAFLRPLTKAEIDKVYEGLLKTPYSILAQGFLNKVNDLKNDDAYTLKLEYLVRIVSEVCGCYCLQEFQGNRKDIKWEDYIEEDTDALRFSYLDTYYSVKELFSAFEQFEDRGASAGLSENRRPCFAGEDRALRLFEESCFYKQGADAKAFIDDYFSFNSDYDEKRARDGKERLRGITTGYLREKSKEQNASDDLTFYGYLLCCMDSGKAALTVDCADDICTCILRSGEQAYRLLTEENQWAIKYLSKIENSLISYCLQDLIPMYMDKYICKLYEKKYIDEEDFKRLRYLSSTVEKSRKNNFDALDSGSDGVKQKLHRRIYMKDYYVERMEESPVPTYDEKLRKVYDSVMAY